MLLLCVVLCCCVLCCCFVVVVFRASPLDPLRRTPLRRTAQNFALFFPSPACFLTTMLRRHPARNRGKRVLKNQSLHWRKVQICCVSQDSDLKKFILRKAGDLRSNASAGHTVKLSGGAWFSKLRERKGPSRGIIQKCEPHERNPCAPRWEERTPEETSRQEYCVLETAWNLAKNVCKLQIKTRLPSILWWKRRCPYLFQNP